MLSVKRGGFLLRKWGWFWFALQLSARGGAIRGTRRRLNICI